MMRREQGQGLAKEPEAPEENLTMSEASGEEQEVDEATLQEGLAQLDLMMEEGPFSFLAPPEDDIPDAEASLQRLEAFLGEREEANQAAQAAHAAHTGASVGWWEQLLMVFQQPALWGASVAILLIIPWVVQPTGEGIQTIKKPPVKIRQGNGMTHKGARTGGKKKQFVLAVSMLHAAPVKSDDQRKGKLRHSIPELVRPGQVLHPGDFVQFRYSAPRPLHIMIVSLNNKGEVFAFHPFQGKRSSKMTPGEQRSIPTKGSFELDDYLGPERFFIVISRRSFPFSLVKKILTHAYKVSKGKIERIQRIPGPWRAHTILIKKVRRSSPADRRPK